MTTVAQVMIDRQNPWPGLGAFNEAAEPFFNGRRSETMELRRLVLNAPLTVLFGASGLGKTSLVQAGLFPSLRKEHLLPVYVRLDVRDRNAPLIDQVKLALQSQIQARRIDVPCFDGDESLWQYLHRAGLEMWSEHNQLLTPLFVFDQFEEVFTLGAENLDAIARLRIELADLIENRMPAALAGTIQADETAGSDVSLDSQRYKVLLSFREDFLPALEAWKREMPSILRNRLRLLPMSGEQAFEAVHATAPHLVDEGIARRIVRFVADAQEEGTGADQTAESMKDLEVEPALLSLVCHGLNEKRKAQRKTAFDEGLLSGSGQSIISDYYQHAVGDLPGRVQRFIEKELITERGFRKPCDIGDARSIHGVTDRELRLLVDRRLLRIEPQRGSERVELTHDLLTRVVREHRDRQRERDRVWRQRRRMAALAVLGVLLAVVAVAFASLYIKADRQRAVAEDERARAVAAVDRAVAAQATAQAESARADQQAGAAGLAKTEAEREARSARSEELAGAALRNLGKNAGILFALRAVFLTYSADKTVLPDVEETLRRAVPALATGLDRPGHTSAITRVVFSPDRKLIATAGLTDGIRIWDASSSEQLQSFGASCNLEPGIVFSRDGAMLACASADSAAVWDVRSGRQLVVVPKFQPRRGPLQKVMSFALSTDGALLATVRGDSAKETEIWEVSSGRMLRTLDYAEPISRVTFGPVDARLMAIAETEVRIWDASSGVDLLTLKQAGEISDLAVQLDGSRLAVALKTGNTVRILDARSGNELLPIAQAGPVGRIAFSADGSRLATASANSIKIWDASSGVELRALPYTGSSIARLFFSPDGSRLVTAPSKEETDAAFERSVNPGITAPKIGGAVQMWDVASGDVLDTAAATEAFAFSTDGKRLAKAQNTSADIEDASTHENPLRILPQDTRLRAGAFSPDLKRLATAGEDGIVVIWDTASGRKLRTLFSVRAHTVVWSGDGKMLATTSYLDSPKVWDAETGRLLHNLSRGNTFTGIAFSPDSKLVATADASGRTQVWEAASGREVRSFSLTGYSVAFASDGRRLAGGGRASAVTVLEATSGKVLSTLPLLQNGVARGLAFSPDGKRLAVVREHGFGIWDTGSSGWKALPGSLADSSVSDTFTVAFSNDGRLLAGPGADQTARLWDAASGKQVLSLFGFNSPVRSVAFSRDGTEFYAIADDWAVYRYPLVLQDLISEAQARISGSLTTNECHDYLHAESCPGWAQAPDYIIEGDKAAKGDWPDKWGDVDRAVASFQKAFEMDTTLRFDPVAHIRGLAEYSPGAKMGWLVKQRKFKDATAVYMEESRLNPTIKIAGGLNNFCWLGITQGQAVEVIDACERAVALDPQNSDIRDSRGVARALTGNSRGAIDDLEFYISHTVNTQNKSQRQKWVAALRSGKNPFTPEEMKTLLQQ